MCLSELARDHWAGRIIGQDQGLTDCHNRISAEDGISYDSKLQTATLTFAEPLPVGDAKLAMSFIGVLNDKMCGFYNSTYTESGEKKQWLSVLPVEYRERRKLLVPLVL